MRTQAEYLRDIHYGRPEVPPTAEEAAAYGTIEGHGEAEGRQAIGRRVGGHDDARRSAESYANAYEIDSEEIRAVFCAAFMTAYLAVERSNDGA